MYTGCNFCSTITFKTIESVAITRFRLLGHRMKSVWRTSELTFCWILYCGSWLDGTAITCCNGLAGWNSTHTVLLLKWLMASVMFYRKCTISISSVAADAFWNMKQHCLCATAVWKMLGASCHTNWLISIEPIEWAHNGELIKVLF